jgi:HAD superfamily 5'-nucleotidase-like hydrolase
MTTGLDLSAVLKASPPSDPTRKIYVNRNLDMGAIKAIGFDMDYTLVQYHQRHLDELTVTKTVDKLIDRFNYPEELRDVQVDYDFIIRGLVVDKRNGNICKVDQNRVVGRCYHGYQALSDEQRIKEYGTKPISLSSERFIRVDTLFSLPESTLMAGIIEHYKRAGRDLPVPVGELCINIRHAIDEAHQDNTLKSAIIAAPDHYIIPDPDIGPTLHKLKLAGKRLFLLTNSEHYYTEAVMTHLLDGVLPFYESWRDYFDIILVNGRKPSFFNDLNPFIKLDDQGNPLDEEVTYLLPRHIYSGGNIHGFEEMTNLTGAEILYIGDHIFSDIVISKRSAWWRTALVIQEMREGIKHTVDHSTQLNRIHQIDRAARQLDDMINYQRTLTRSLERVQKLIVALTSPETHVIDSTREHAEREIKTLTEQLDAMLKEAEELERDIDIKVNRYWGRHFRERHELSSFGAQVMSYADIYTSQVSNFLFYSPDQHFRAERSFLPHEREHLMLDSLSST